MRNIQGWLFDIWFHRQGQSAAADWSFRYPAHGWLLSICFWNLDEGIVSTLHC